MNRLVYGVGLASSGWDRPLPAGPAGCSTNVLRQDELAAAYSATILPEASPSTAYLLTYARVIEQLHRRGPFAPMRFGCQLADEAAIRNLLRARQDDFLTLLDEIAGCDEFGLRILSGVSEPLPEGVELRQSCESAFLTAEGAGGRYLSDRRQWYARRDARRQLAEAVAENFRAAFEGLYVRCQSAAAEAGSIASLSFLVRRKHQPRFHKKFRSLQATCSDKLLLTGPWPAYHFVALSGAEATPSPAALLGA
ncbi:MAG TPA: GvpL/GvpF family gas vesicle protein [Pirellulales bacterium]|nr:GvpL/GvpF family gas vesicle protein [Pirellulales bacterium]